MVRASNGSEVPLLAMVDVGVNPAATSIQRQSRQTMLKVEAGLAKDVSMQDARKAIESTLNGMQFPPGYGYTFEGGGFNINFDGMAQMHCHFFSATASMPTTTLGVNGFGSWKLSE